MARIMTIDDVDFRDKTALVRVDFNSPVDPETKKVLDDGRIRAHARTTIDELSERGAKVVILAHQGRPGGPDFISLEQHADILKKILKRPVRYVDDLFGDEAKKAIRDLKGGEILVLKNVRTYPEERKKGTPEEHSETEFVRKLSPLADVFVNDAFAAAHRGHVSIVGFTAVLPSVAGRIMEREIKALKRVLEAPEKPCVFILGGAKGDDSLEISQYVLENRIADRILTSGVIGHLFLAAKGVNLGKSNNEFLEKKGLMGLVAGIRALIAGYPGKIETPVDLAVEVEGKRKEITVEALPTSHPMYDVGERTCERYEEVIRESKSIVLSGPVGVFENKEFMTGTKRVLEAIASSKAFSLIGGGHTVAAAEKLGLTKSMSYVSTAGGALIEFLMGKKLAGVEGLERAAARELR